MKMPIRTHDFELTGDYTEWKFTARTNIPVGTIEQLQTGKMSDIVLGLSDILLSWNFVDENGEDLKAYHSENGGNKEELITGPCIETIRLRPGDLLVSVTTAIAEHIQTLPK